MSTSMREALKPCPFCGSKSLTLTVNEHHWKIVECDDCGMRGPCIDLEDEEYRARWNVRAALSSPAPDRLSEEERKVVEEARSWGTIGRVTAILVAIIDRLSGQPEAEPVASNLAARCQEILDWQATGKLCDGELRKLAATLDIPEHHRLDIAESRTAKEAMAFVIASPRLDREKVAEWVNSRVELAAEIAERHLGKSEAEYIASDIRGLKLSVGIMRETRS